MRPDTGVSIVAGDTLAWYVIHTKPRQEQRALQNLLQQGYQCYLPMFSAEKLSRARLTVSIEPLFPRYLFIRLDTGRTGQSWTAIRSTFGVSALVTFGLTPAKIDDAIIEALEAHQEMMDQAPQRLFASGERLNVFEGPFAGMEAVYQMPSGENRVMVLIELMGKLVQMQLPPASLRKVS